MIILLFASLLLNIITLGALVAIHEWRQPPWP